MYGEDMTTIQFRIQDDSPGGMEHTRAFTFSNTALVDKPNRSRREMMEVAVKMAAEVIKDHLDERGIK